MINAMNIKDELRYFIKNNNILYKIALKIINIKDRTWSFANNKYVDFKFSKKGHIYSQEEPIYYIIRRRPPGLGFFSNFNGALGNAVFADDLGYIPVVDMENYRTLYNEKRKVNNSRNAWNYYFTNKVADLEAAYKSKNYILSDGKSRECFGYATVNERNLTADVIKKYNECFNKYWGIRCEIMHEVDTYIQNNKIDNNTLGIHIRGTDWIKMAESSNGLYRIPMNVEDKIKVILKIICKYGFNKIYLCSDEEEIIKKISNKCEVVFNRPGMKRIEGGGFLEGKRLDIAEVIRKGQMGFIMLGRISGSIIGIY